MSENQFTCVRRERRYLLRDLPEPLTRASEHVQITDNYITGTRLRLRRIRVPATKERIWMFTQTGAPSQNDLSLIAETDIYLSAYEYEVLSVFEGNEIRRNRYPFEHEGRAFEIDVYLGALWGLVLARTSFATIEEMKDFSPPSFALADVTNDETFTGRRLVELTIDDFRSRLEQK